ncbi:MAG: Ig-like domain-containing protein [Candidatus Limivicinus sp.]|jgi:hypothetical protein
MKTMKKAVSILLLACMLASVMCVSAFAAGTPAKITIVNADSPITMGNGSSVITFTFIVSDSADQAVDGQTVDVKVNGKAVTVKPTDSEGKTAYTVCGADTLIHEGQNSIEAIAGTASASKNFTVDPAPVVPGKVVLDKYEINLNGYGATDKISASFDKGVAAAGEFTFTSNAPAIASVDGDGNVTALSAGTTTVVVASKTHGFTAPCTVNVNISKTAITVTPEVSGMEVGAPAIQFTAKVEPAEADQTVEWISSNSGVVSIDQNGIATAKAAGTATITVRSMPEKAPSYQFTINVTDPNVNGVSIDGRSPMKVGENQEITAKLNGDVHFHHWEIVTSSLISVANPNGQKTTLTALAPGRATLRAYVADNKNSGTLYSSGDFYIDITSAGTLQLVANPESITTGQTSTITVQNAVNGETFSWVYTPSLSYGVVDKSSANATSATITAGGLVGTVTVTATSNNNKSRTASCTIKVNTPSSTGVAQIFPSVAYWSRGAGDLNFRLDPPIWNNGIVIDNQIIYNTSGNNYYTYYNGRLTLKSALLSKLDAGSHILQVGTANPSAPGENGTAVATIYINGYASNYGDTNHVKGSPYNLYFNASSPIKGVYISNQWIDPANYVLSNDGKSLMLKSGFLNMLNYGNYTMTLDTGNNTSQTATFRIVTANYAPATGDSNNMFIWLAVLVISGAGIMALIPRKKKQLQLPR